MGIGAPNQSPAVRRDNFARRPHLGEHRPGNAEDSQQLVVPVERREVEQQRAAGVAIVRDMPSSAAEPPDEPGVDGAEEHLAPLGPGAKPVMRVEQMLDLGAGEIGVQPQAGLGPEGLFQALGPEPIADSRARRGSARRRRWPPGGRSRGPRGSWFPAGWRCRLRRSRRLAATRGPRQPSPPRAASTRSPRDRAPPVPAPAGSAGVPACAEATVRPSRSKTIARLEVVPWSRARMYCFNAPPPQATARACKTISWANMKEQRSECAVALSSVGVREMPRNIRRIPCELRAVPIEPKGACASLGSISLPNLLFYRP